MKKKTNAEIQFNSELAENLFKKCDNNSFIMLFQEQEADSNYRDLILRR